jgi:hypothetical protein
MAPDSILGGSELVAFAPTTDPTKALEFYQGVLGLRLIANEKPSRWCSMRMERCCG